MQFAEWLDDNLPRLVWGVIGIVGVAVALTLW